MGAASPLRIDVSREGPAAWVRFERAGVLNALGPDDLVQLATALRTAGTSGARVVIVRGEGGAFSAGDDLRETAALDAPGWLRVVEGFHELTRTAVGLDVPIVCGIDGACIGGAFEFACSCDLRIATPRARFGCPEVGVGIAVSNAASVLLPALCGLGFASELIITGRLVGAEEALAHGLVNRVVEPEELDGALSELAAEIGARAPLAVAASKRLVHDALAPAVAAAMARETVAGATLFSTRDAREGLAAFLEKRNPGFTGA
ncbi:MAG: enoyl-CoA hydratase/isomerase family protein [Gaiellales bacterium]